MVESRTAWLAGAVVVTGMLASCGAAGSSGGAGAVSASRTVTSGCAGHSAEMVARAGSLYVGGELNGVAAVSAASVWAVGSTDLGNPVTVHWNGRTWKQVLTSVGNRLTSPSGGYLNAVAVVSSRDVWAAGAGPGDSDLVEHWDGRTWSRTPAPDPGGGTVLQGVAAASAADVWAVGGTNDTNKTVIIHWNGTGWTQVPSPTPAGVSSDLYAVAVTSARSAWAVGETWTDAGRVPLIEHWNGISWTLVPSPVIRGGGGLAGVAAASPASAWAVGTYDKGEGGGLIERWNGRAWTLVPSPRLGFLQLRGVTALSPADAWAVGDTVCLGKGEPTVIERWNGRAWTLVPSPASGMLTGVSAVSAASAWAVGFSTAYEEAVIEHWNGTTWTWPPGFCASPAGSGCVNPSNIIGS